MLLWLVVRSSKFANTLLVLPQWQRQSNTAALFYHWTAEAALVNCCLNPQLTATSDNCLQDIIIKHNVQQVTYCGYQSKKDKLYVRCTLKTKDLLKPNIWNSLLCTMSISNKIFKFKIRQSHRKL